MSDSDCLGTANEHIRYLSLGEEVSHYLQTKNEYCIEKVRTMKCKSACIPTHCEQAVHALQVKRIL